MLKANARVVARFTQISPADVKLCSVVKAELYYEARASQQIASNLAALDRFFSPFNSLPFDDASAEAYGQLRTDLQRTGQPIGPNNMMIAAIALAADLTVVTHDTREFNRVPGLKLEDWEAAS